MYQSFNYILEKDYNFNTNSPIVVQIVLSAKLQEFGKYKDSNQIISTILAGKIIANPIFYLYKNKATLNKNKKVPDSSQKNQGMNY